MVELIQVTEGDRLEQIRELFKEYVDWLGFDLGFQDFESEIRDLPGEYAPPEGYLLLAVSADEPVGCGALRKFEDDVCEMNRLYVRSDSRGKGIGRRLAVALLDRAREIGYKRMRLDTVPWMTEAIALYESLGFVEIEAYRYNPIEGAKYMELILE